MKNIIVFLSVDQFLELFFPSKRKIFVLLKFCKQKTPSYSASEAAKVRRLAGSAGPDFVLREL